MALIDDSRLIGEAKAGSAEAINRLFERVGPRLLALIRLRLGPQLRNHLESGDVLQQTMMQAFQQLPAFKGAAEPSLMAWLGAIANHEIQDQARYVGRQRRDARRNVALDDVGELVADQVRSAVSRLHFTAMAQRLETALETLTPPHREVILLRRFEELSFAEIGERMGKSPDAARMLYTRAMTALTLQVHDHDNDA